MGLSIPEPVQDPCAWEREMHVRNRDPARSLPASRIHEEMRKTASLLHLGQGSGVWKALWRTGGWSFGVACPSARPWRLLNSSLLLPSLATVPCCILSSLLRASVSSWPLYPNVYGSCERTPSVAPEFLFPLCISRP